MRRQRLDQHLIAPLQHRLVVEEAHDGDEPDATAGVVDERRQRRRLAPAQLARLRRQAERALTEREFGDGAAGAHGREQLKAAAGVVAHEQREVLGADEVDEHLVHRRDHVGQLQGAMQPLQRHVEAGEELVRAAGLFQLARQLLHAILATPHGDFAQA